MTLEPAAAFAAENTPRGWLRLTGATVWGLVTGFLGAVAIGYERHPGWDFETNVGYSTPEHRAAIAMNGVSPLHRMSFASIAYQQLPLGG